MSLWTDKMHPILYFLFSSIESCHFNSQWIQFILFLSINYLFRYYTRLKKILRLQKAIHYFENVNSSIKRVIACLYLQERMMVLKEVEHIKNTKNTLKKGFWFLSIICWWWYGAKKSKFDFSTVLILLRDFDFFFFLYWFMLSSLKMPRFYAKINRFQ